LLSHWYVVHATTLFVKSLVCGTCYDIVC